MPLRAMVEAIAAQAFANFSELRTREVRRNNLPRTPVNKGKKRKGRSLTLRPFGDDSRITLGLRNLVVKLAKAKLIQ